MIAVSAGIVAGSIALVGFGFNSLIEAVWLDVSFYWSEGFGYQEGLVKSRGFSLIETEAHGGLKKI